MQRLDSVTVIIAVFNGEKYIEESIESVLKQVGIGVPKVIVVNDGSTDKTSSILEKYSDSIKIIKTRNIGQAAAINKALKIVNTNFVAYQDADDVSEPNRFHRQLQVFNENKDIEMVYSGRNIINSSGQIVEIDDCRDFDCISIYQTNPITRSSVMHKFDLINKLGDFDDSISGNDDWDMWIRISEIGRIYRLPEHLVRYRVHDENLSKRRNRALFHNRLCKFKILEKSCKRRPDIAYLNIMKIRARINSLLFQYDFSERPLSFWSRIDKIQELIEYYIIKKFYKIVENKL